MIESKVKTKDGFESIVAYSVDEFKPPTLIFKDLQRNHKMTKFATDYICLDTETSKLNVTCAWVYQWAICIKQKIFVYGRTPSELNELLIKLMEHYELSDEKKIIIYIHNAGYDFSYLKLFFMKLDPTLDVLAIDNHTVLTIDMIGFRIICSYKLTNLSLAVLSDKYAKKYIKAVGEIDYSLVKYQDSELGANDWLYMFSDVASQYDGVKQYLLMNNYKFCADAPFTSTGFVRVDCRKASRRDKKWRSEFDKMRLDLKQYRLCRQGFMGGICICSFLYSDRTIRVVNGKCQYINQYGDKVTIKNSKGLGHKDFTSSYPARQKLNSMPKGKPMWLGAIESRAEFNRLLKKYHCVFYITLYNLEIKKGVTAPYIPSSKCLGTRDLHKVNGKVTSAKELTIAITELDFKWIKRQYTADNFKVFDMLCFKKGKMPNWLKEEIMYYFTNKCTLKNTEPVLYAKSKNLLNGIYGMTATSIIRPTYKIQLQTDEKHKAGDIFHFIGDKTDEMTPEQLKAYIDQKDEEALNKYYNSHNSFMPYQYSLYTTAWARDALMTMIEATGDSDGYTDFKNPKNDDLTDVYKNFLYCDTDSVFYIKTEANEKRLADYERECIELAKSGGAYVGENYLGAPTDEAPIRAFRGLHAKCYAMEEYHKKKRRYELEVVIAGIPKKSIKWLSGNGFVMPYLKTNAEELGSIDNLTDGFTFEHCGGTRCVYNNERDIEIADINGHRTELATSAVIDNISKVLSDTMWTHGADKSILSYTIITP